LERHRQKLLDAYMAGALPVDLLKERQTRIEAEIADAKRLMQNAQTASEEVFTRLEQVISLLTHAEKRYTSVGDEAREILNTAIFQTFQIDSHPEDGTNAPVIIDAPLTGPVAAVTASKERTPEVLTHPEGSNLIQLAVLKGFEPLVGLHPQTLSRRSP
jgi:hypothetical protein